MSFRIVLVIHTVFKSSWMTRRLQTWIPEHKLKTTGRYSSLSLTIYNFCREAFTIKPVHKGKFVGYDCSGVF